MIESVIVLGGGSAGYLAAITLKKRLPHLSVTVIRSRELGVIGVGESTTAAVPNHLHGYLEIDPGEFHRLAQPSFKLGVRLLWGPRESFDYTFQLQMDWKWDPLRRSNGFYCDDELEYVDVSSSLMSAGKGFLRKPDGDPYISRDFGYHIDNQRFVTFLEGKAQELGVVSLDDVMTDARCDENGISELHFVAAGKMSADLYVDCTGFRSLLLGKALEEPHLSFKTTLFNDRAVVGTWQREEENINPYTTVETMTAGWCWRIDHPDSIMRGYVYSSSFISDEDAEREFREKNPKIQSTRVIQFTSGRYQRNWVKNVVAIGNSAGFVEPLESTSLAVICDESRFLAEVLLETDARPTPGLIATYNQVNARAWDMIRDFLGIHFKFNTRLETAYWKECRKSVELGPIQALVDYYQENGPSTFARTTLLHGNDIFGMEGYLVLLVGQKVPHRAKYTPTADERRFWDAFRAENRAKAHAGMTIREALDRLYAPSWRWVPGFFGNRPIEHQPSTAQLTSFIGVQFASIRRV